MEQKLRYTMWARVCLRVCVLQCSIWGPDPSGRTVYGVHLRYFDWWYHGFESCRGSSCSVAFVVCRVSSGLCDGLITGSVEPCRVYVCLSVIELETSNIRRPRPGLLRRRRKVYVWGRTVSFCLFTMCLIICVGISIRSSWYKAIFLIIFCQQYSWRRNQKGVDHD